MTDEQINAVIAGACGWKNIIQRESCLDVSEWIGTEPISDRTYLPCQVIPNYCGDLNAMHEAEEFITGAIFRDYFEWLTRNAKGLGIRATARQRAEAFLRTLGKWEEVQP